jgi:hypothetical protein
MNLYIAKCMSHQVILKGVFDLVLCSNQPVSSVPTIAISRYNYDMFFFCLTTFVDNTSIDACKT